MRDIINAQGILDVIYKMVIVILLVLIIILLFVASKIKSKRQQKENTLQALQSGKYVDVIKKEIMPAEQPAQAMKLLQSEVPAEDADPICDKEELRESIAQIYYGEGSPGDDAILKKRQHVAGHAKTAIINHAKFNKNNLVPFYERELSSNENRDWWDDDVNLLHKMQKDGDTSMLYY